MRTNSQAIRSCRSGLSFDGTALQIGSLVLLLLLVIVIMRPGMVAPPFSDDGFQLRHSRTLDHWTEAFGRDALGFYRPVKNLLFMAASKLEHDPPGWHWIGLTAYLAGAVGVHRIVSIVLKSPLAAWCATAVWALSPTCVSTALWLSCANISIGIALAAVAFHYHERSFRRNPARTFAIAAVAYAGTFLCYESLIAVPGLLFLRDLQQRRIGINGPTAIRYAVFTLVAVAFLVLRHHASANEIGRDDFHTGFAPGTESYQLTLSAPWFLWRHFLMWVFPFGKIEVLGSYAWLGSTPVAGIIGGWCFLAAMLGGAALLWTRLPRAAYGILFFLVASFPAGNFLPTFNGPIYDAYLTIPSIGLAIAVAAVCDHLLRLCVVRKNRGLAGAPALLLIACALLFYRIPVSAAYSRFWAGVWADPLRLVLLISESRPMQFQSKSFASLLLQETGYHEQAENLAHETLREAPWSSVAMLALGRVANQRGEDEQAELWFRRAIDAEDVTRSVKNTALLGMAESIVRNPARREEAADICRGLLRQDAAGQPPATIALLASIYQKQGNLPKARTTLERGLEFHPDETVFLEMLAKLPTASAIPPIAAPPEP